MSNQPLQSTASKAIYSYFNEIVGLLAYSSDILYSFVYSDENLKLYESSDGALINTLKEVIDKLWPLTSSTVSITNEQFRHRMYYMVILFLLQHRCVFQMLVHIIRNLIVRCKQH